MLGKSWRKLNATRFVELGRYLCEVRAGQYWKSFNVPGKTISGVAQKSLLPDVDPRALAGTGEKGIEGSGADEGIGVGEYCETGPGALRRATWLHKAREMPKEKFKQEVERELTGQETEPWEMVYFKLYKSQIPVVEQAIEAAALMLASDKSRGYCLEMIRADFLAGTNLESESPEVLLQSALRFFKFLPGEDKQTFLHHVTENAS
jgi:hypothetical protein